MGQWWGRPDPSLSKHKTEPLQTAPQNKILDDLKIPNDRIDLLFAPP
jgi:hypothetical protein